MSDDPDNYKEIKIEAKITMDTEGGIPMDEILDALGAMMTEQEMDMRCSIGALDDYRMTNEWPEDLVTTHELDLLREIDWLSEYIERLRIWLGDDEWMDFFDDNRDFFGDEEE